MYIHWCIIVSSKLASSDIAFFSDCVSVCGGKAYDEDEAICCKGWLYAIAEDRENVACCNVQIYNTVTHYCCLDRLFEFRVVPKALGKSGEDACSKEGERTYNILIAPMNSTF